MSKSYGLFWMMFVCASSVYCAQERQWKPCDLVFGHPHQNVLSLNVSTSGVEVSEKRDQKNVITHAFRTRDGKAVPSLTEVEVPQEIKTLEEGYTPGKCLISGDQTYCIVSWLLSNGTLAKIVSYTRSSLASDFAQLSLN